jgi:hypothetical protein
MFLFDQTADECSQEAEIKVSYLCFLLDVTKSVLTTEKGQVPTYMYFTIYA